jgi:transglutaminase-like putative cysteine protease
MKWAILFVRWSGEMKHINIIVCAAVAILTCSQCNFFVNLILGKPLFSRHMRNNAQRERHGWRKRPPRNLWIDLSVVWKPSMMFVRIALVCLIVPMVAQAQDGEVHYAPSASWVVPMRPHEPFAGRKEGPLFFTYSDTQTLIDGKGTEEYFASRIKLLNSEALAAGNVNIAWKPDSGAITVHHLRIIRDGEVIDVLKDTKFSVFQPQNAIEYSILSGQKLANFQVPGLRVGDEIEFAYTVRSRERAFPENSYGLTQVGAVPAPGSFRIRMTWPDGKEPKWRASEDISGQLNKQTNALEVRLDDPATLQLPEGAPPRYAFKRTLEFSDFKSWPQLSKKMAPLFSGAARLPADSRIKELAARIKAESSDPISRARAALKLVQDEVRYVYVEMNGGNLIPAEAERTWERRYGDCKAKTVLLMALLSEMEITARPVLVNSNGGDGINEHLPSPQLFDHVMVQANLGGTWYWLDGTRTGDLRIRAVPPDFYKWVLPLTAEGADISPIVFVPLNAPEEINVTDIDASAGYDKPAKFTLQRIIRGNDALALREALASLPVSEGESRLKQMFSGSFADVESAHWKFDSDSATLVLSVIARGMVDWEKDSGDTRWSNSIIGAGFYPPPRRKRNGQQDSRAPWSNDPHGFSCQVTTMHLPKADPGWIWSHNSKAIDQVIGGVAYWRMADLTDGTMRTVMAKRTLADEISPEQAEVANNQIPGFNNNQSQVYQIKGPGGRSELEVADKSIKEVPSATDHDWVKDSSPCVAPRLR